MPTTALIELPPAMAIGDIFASFQAARDEVETFVWQVNHVARHEGTEHDLAPVTLEGIGVVASVLADVGAIVDDLVRFRDTLSESLFALGAIRAEQGRIVEAAGTNG